MLKPILLSLLLTHWAVPAEQEWRGTNINRYVIFYDDRDGAVRGHFVDSRAVTHQFRRPAFDAAGRVFTADNHQPIHMESSWSGTNAVATFTNQIGHRVSIKFQKQ